MKFRSQATKGSWLSLVMAAGFLLAGIGLATSLPGRPASASLFWLTLFALVCFGLAGYFVYTAYALFCLSYAIDRNGLRIWYGAFRRQIPITSITNIIPAADILLPERRLFGLRLPDWWAGTWQGTAFYTTVTPHAALVAQTEQGNFVISPDDPTGFIRAWQMRIPLGPTRTWPDKIVRWRLFGHPIWFDKLAWRLAGGAILFSIILIGLTLTMIPSWPRTVRLDLNLAGQSELLIAREQLLWFPAIGAVILLVNLLLGISWYRRDRMAAYLLWTVALVVQIGLWIGLRMIVG